MLERIIAIAAFALSPALGACHVDTTGPGTEDVGTDSLYCLFLPSACNA